MIFSKFRLQNPETSGPVLDCTARQNRAQHRCYSPHHPSPVPIPCSPSPACLEVDGVDTQVVGVKVAELGQGLAEVVHALDGVAQGVHHLLAMAADLVGAGVGLPPARPPRPWGPWAHPAPLQGLGSEVLLVALHLIPDGLDQLLVVGGQHGGGWQWQTRLGGSSAHGDMRTTACSVSSGCRSECA
uniref:Uncharacterized protein n=1 Tax=Buteo japonicus TaxID=224669 RepID=A0A8C0HN25_9AVES